MLKFIMALVLVGFSGSFANAIENFSPAESSADQAMTEMLRPPRYPGPGGPRRGFYIQWRDAYTGQSITGWTPSNTPTCGHGDNCACGGQNYCGQYGEGQQANYWDRGCWNQPRVIVCEVQAR
jgi:hypothetical protein